VVIVAHAAWFTLVGQSHALRAFVPASWESRVRRLCTARGMDAGAAERLLKDRSFPRRLPRCPAYRGCERLRFYPALL